MCLGNRANAVTYWVNQQLSTLWNLSVECVEKHGRGIKPCKPEIAHGTCLAQLCVGRHRPKPCTEDLLFFSAFDCPKIQFICNHDILIQFRLKSGHFKLDTKGSIENFQDYTCAFRVPFRQHLITDITYANCGQTDVCKAKFLILDLNAAEFVREHSGFAKGHKCEFEDVDRKQRMIVKYLRTEYLPLLRRGGFHFIHSLPDFDILSRSHQIDWSVVTEVDIETLNVFNISVEVINSFLKGRWLDAASCVDELDDDHDHSRFGDFALAEHRGACDDFHFHAFFGPPQIRALCSKEVVFFMDVQDLQIYTEGGFKGEAQHKYSNWTIAVVAEISFIEEEGGNVRRLRLDFSKARFCEGLSYFGEDCNIIEDAFFCKIRSMFVHYMSFRYLSILQEFGCDHIYRIDVRVVEEEEFVEEEEEIEFEFSEEEFRERLCITETFGFDILTAVTQASINCHFRCLWKASQGSGSCISEWSFDDNFEATFGAIQIQLPCDSSSNSVIVYFTLREGALKVLDCHKRCIDGEKHAFSSWRVAFEVKLKLREYTKAHAISDGCLRECESVGEYVNHQLVLDFESARFCPELSRLPGLFDDSHYRLTRSKRQALIHYITRFYFAELKGQGLHILYTFPIWKASGTCRFNRFAPSAFSFQFYGASFGEDGGAVSSLFGRRRCVGNRNMIVICGMVDNRRRPSFPLPRCTWSWCSSQDVFSGVLVLSRAVFLEGWLLRELASVNCRTTLVPVFNGIGNSGEWIFELVTLEGYERGKERSCEWRQIAANACEIEFEHRNKEMWSYDHTGDTCHIHNGCYSVSCETVNTLIVPTVSKRCGCEIRLSGKVILHLSFKGEQKSWSTSAVARWSYTISIMGGAPGHGLKISTRKSSEISEGSGFIGDFDIVHARIKDASTLLSEKLIDVLIVEETTIKELTASFCGLWPLFYSGAYGYTLCNPVFNLRGDLILELESPLDCHGQVVVSGRDDICLPSRQRACSRPSLSICKEDLEDSHESIRESSFSTTATALDEASIRTPSSERGMVTVKVAAELAEVERDSISIEGLQRSTEEKVHRNTGRREAPGRVMSTRY